MSFLRRGEWVRFIPAGAGNTPQQPPSDSRGSVYPRWREEHGKPKPPPPTHSGLSPLARGTLVANEAISNQFRFIPASAGNTGNWKTKSWLSPVYPRWRGEHIKRQARSQNLYGLSPLARGTHTRRESCCLPCRFIPAGAGNTHPIASITCKSSVYPRWRGEHSSQQALRATNAGLSPLARGTRARDNDC